jgi:hypothetical protein
VAAAAGLALFTGEVVDGSSVFLAFTEGAGVAFFVLVLAGAGQRVWGGDRISAAQGPGGLGLGFDAAESAVGKLNERVNDHVADINKRLYDLESRVFKADD